MYIEIDKRVLELNDSQAFIYLMIVYNKFQRRQINRQYLANALGVTNKDYISEVITAIEDKGIIKRRNYTAHTYSEGWIDVKLDGELIYKDSFKVSIDFVRDREISQKAKGFALRYRCICDHCLNVSLNKKSMAIELNISRPTLNKYLVYMDCIEKYFFKDIKKEELTSEEINTLYALSSDNCIDGQIKESCTWFLERNLQRQNNCKQLYNRAISGTLFNTKKKSIKYETYNNRYSFRG